MTTEQDFVTIRQKHNDSRERRRLKRLWWAVALIWAGLVFGADRMGLLPQIGDSGAWSWIFLGAGLAGLLGSLYRWTVSSIPHPTTWDWVWAGICLIAGLDGFVTLNVFWPVVLILAGAIALVSGFRSRDQEAA